MKFEEALHTSKFANENAKAQLNILHTASILECYFTVWFRRYGLSMQQYNVMRIVRGQTPNWVSVKDITMRVVSKNSNTTRIIDKLESKKLITRQISEIDKRVVNVVLTPIGCALLTKIDGDNNKEHLHKTALEDHDAESLNALLDKLRETFESIDQTKKVKKPLEAFKKLQKMQKVKKIESS
jgi:DNA-binding MarR family transcriptional regulator